MRIRNWHKFQHFKDRRPPWIKLHREILDQRDIALLSDRAFRILVSLWLLASEDETMRGELPENKDIAWRLRLSEKDLTKSLQELNEFLIQDDNKLITSCYHADDPETETETETETEKRHSIDRARQKSESQFNAFWEAYPRKVGKGAARKAWKTVNQKTTLDVILKAIEKQKGCKQWREAAGRYIPHPATWLNREGWLDEPDGDDSEYTDIGF